MGAAPLLRLDALELAYDSAKTKIFADLSLAVPRGRAIVLRGPSGVGKSTLLRCMAGLEARASGELRFEGKRVAPSDMPTFRMQAVYVAQTPPRMPMRVEDSLRAPFEFRHQEQSYNREHVEALCEQLLLPTSLLDQEFSELSGGEAQRFGVLRALTLRPKLLLLDEPASSLDAKSRGAMASALERWSAAGDRSSVICSHEPNWCQRLLTDAWDLGADGALATKAFSS